MDKVFIVLLVVTLWSVCEASYHGNFGKPCSGTCYRFNCPPGFTKAGRKNGKCSFYKHMVCCVRERAQKMLYANCAVKPNPGNTAQPVSGNVKLSQPVGGKLKLEIDLTGFDKNDADVYHGFHAHTYGDLSGGCGSSGGHFNPAGVTHGAPDDNRRHVGDFGNIKEDGNGNIKTTITDKLATLKGKKSIIGRAIVIHAKRDDLGKGGDAGSLATGNAGARLACCVVGIAPEPPSA